MSLYSFVGAGCHLPYDISAQGSFLKRRRTPRQVLDVIEEMGIAFVDLHLTDVPGRLRHVTIPAEMISEKTFTDGVAKLDGSSIKGFTEIFESDMVLLPDPSTFGVIPWEGTYKTARLICDVMVGFGRGKFARDPRRVAQEAAKMLESAGYTESLWGPEVEFFVFDGATWQVSDPFSNSFKISSQESAVEARGTNFPIRFKDGYYPAPPVDTLSDYRSECVTNLRDGFGILCNAHHHEVATAGQCEIDMYRDALVQMADSVMTYKFVTKNVASRRGLIASTMPKPIFGDNAVGMHTHSSLWNGERNAFFDADDGYAEISQTARHYIGGLLEHSRALCAIVAPTTNSYRRLVPGYEAPVYVAWSKSNRSANVRIPVYEKGRAGEGAKRCASWEVTAGVSCRSGATSSRIQNARPWVETTRSSSLITRSVIGTTGRSPRGSSSGVLPASAGRAAAVARAAASLIASATPGAASWSGHHWTPPSSEK